MDTRSFVTKISKFGMVGVITTFFGIICYYFFLEKWSWPLYPTYGFVFFMGSILSYLMNSKFTFGHNYNIRQSARYISSYLLGLCVGLSLLFVFKKIFGNLSDFHLVLLVIIPRFLFTYIILTNFVFNKEQVI